MYLTRPLIPYLNSLTKYPSIDTYHKLGEKGRLLDEVNHTFTGEVVLTEKVDGTNGRIVITPWGEWLIGSREEFFTASGDIVYNPMLGIVDALRPVAGGIKACPPPDTLLVFYFEVFGGGIGQYAKNYTTSKTEFGVRLFDVVRVDDVKTKLDWDREKIASWRDHGGQFFLPEASIKSYADMLGVERVPVIDILDAKDVPTSIAGMHEFLKVHAPGTKVKLDETGRGNAEGLVLRTRDRGTIAKARFEDYDRTARILAKEAAAKAPTKKAAPVKAATKAVAPVLPEQKTTQRRYGPARRSG